MVVLYTLYPPRNNSFPLVAEDGRKYCIILGADAKALKASYIDRADKPNYGSGPVYIAHDVCLKIDDLKYCGAWGLSTKADDVNNYIVAPIGCWVECRQTYPDGERVFFRITDLGYAYACDYYMHYNLQYTKYYKGTRVYSKHPFLGSYYGTRYVMCPSLYNGETGPGMPRYMEDRWGWFDVNVSDISLIPPKEQISWPRPEGTELLRFNVVQDPKYNYREDLLSTYGDQGFLTAPCGYAFNYEESSGDLTDNDIYKYWISKVSDLPGNSRTNLAVKTAGFYQAFYNAMEELPKLEQNMFANILQLVSTLNSLLRTPYEAPKDVVKTAKDSWLAYRYSYNTTKSDIQEVADIAGRLTNLSRSEKQFTVYGRYKADNYTYMCAVTIDVADFIKKGAPFLSNLRLNATNIWDMIPYSFVIDWFAHIGDYTKSFDEWLDTEIPIKSIWYSVSYKKGYSQQYARFLGNKPSLPRDVTYGKTSRKTIVMRILDCISLKK